MSSFGFGRYEDRRKEYAAVLLMHLYDAVLYGPKLLDFVKQELEDATLTNFILLANGIDKNPRNLGLIEKLKESGCGWAAKKIVYQLPDEDRHEMIRRIAQDYHVTHAVDYKSGVVSVIAKTPGLKDIHLNRVAPNHRTQILKWVAKKSPKFMRPYPIGMHSRHIINTGAHATK